ncbi:hypothetical protein ACFFHH_20175 [Cytobacillus solani]|uniref:hypothetical protein n=1 Tax=Cytobacillus solani TaxID=1637975 RepID=UPI001152ED54|nr:hypothetical protein [Cytobacillus solani]
MKTDFSNFKLTIDWKPSAYHGHTVRKALTSTLWKKIRNEVLRIHNNTCSICGLQIKEEEQTRKLQVHEIEEYSQDELLVFLKDLKLVCYKCHSFQHFGRTSSVVNREEMNELIQHFMKVNNCTLEDYKAFGRYVSKKKFEDFNKKIIEKRLNGNKDNCNYKLDKTVLFRIEGDIPFKDEAIEQLTRKGLFRYYDDE